MKLELIQRLEELRDAMYTQYHANLEKDVRNGATLQTIVNNQDLGSTEKLIMIDLVLNLSDEYVRSDCYRRMGLQRIVYNNNLNRLIEKGWVKSKGRSIIELNRIF